jgi:hypothetical protein
VALGKNANNDTCRVLCNSNITTSSKVSHIGTNHIICLSNFSSSGRNISKSTCHLSESSFIEVSAKIVYRASLNISCFCVLRLHENIAHHLVYVRFHIGETVYIKGTGPVKHLITEYLGDNIHYILDKKITVTSNEISRIPTIKVPLDRLNRILNTTVEPDPQSTVIYKEVYKKFK